LYFASFGGRPWALWTSVTLGLYGTQKTWRGACILPALEVSLGFWGLLRPWGSKEHRKGGRALVFCQLWRIPWDLGTSKALGL
jgi:hypothetical protein